MLTATTDIGNAKIEGLEDSLGMTGNDYNVALMVFFIPYVRGQHQSSTSKNR